MATFNPKHAGTTHIKRYRDDSPPEEFRKGRHGLMFRYSNDSGWVRTTIPEHRLLPIDGYRHIIARWK